MRRMYVALAAAVLTGPLHGSDMPAATVHESTGTMRIARIVREFDFEDARIAPVEFPLQFVNLAEERGYSLFGSMALTNEIAMEGDWSFRFDLDGNSLAAGVPTGLIPIMPLTDYDVEVSIRTDGVRHARARVIAMLHDVDGRPIPESRVESPGLQTRGRWERVLITVRGNAPRAADLVVQLELVQPPPSDDPAHPSAIDVTGNAWFDDLIIRHRPRIELAIDAEHSIVQPEQTPVLSVRVRDVTTDFLEAHLAVHDLRGGTVHQDIFPAPRGEQPLDLPIPVTRPGAYEAVLGVHSGESVVGVESIRFVILPKPRRRAATNHRPTTVILPHDSLEQAEDLPALIKNLNVGGAVLSIWNADSPPSPTIDDGLERRALIESLLTHEIDLTLALETAPPSVASAAGRDPDDVITMLARDAEFWKPQLESMLVNYGFRVERWQIGSIEETSDFRRRNMQSILEEATSALAPYLAMPNLAIAWRGDQEPPPPDELPSIHVLAPHEIMPKSLPIYAAVWLDGGRDVLLTLESAPRDRYGARVRAVDLVLRTLYAWRAGVKEIAIPAPWQRGETIEPDSDYAVWRMLSDALQGRTFAGEISLEPGAHAWIMAGDSSTDHALVCWRDDAVGDGHSIFSMRLSARPLELVDSFGDVRTLPLIDGQHHVPVGDLPVFVDGIDLALAKFRASLKIEPGVVEAIHRIHDGTLVIQNPWPATLTGEVHLRDAPDCEVSPRVHQFLLDGFEETRIPIELLVSRSVLMGSRAVIGAVKIEAFDQHEFDQPILLEVGWKDLEMAAGWRLARDAETGAQDLIITVHVANQGEEMVNLNAIVRAPGVGYTRRVIAGLAPRTTAIRSFRMPGGAQSLSGQTIRISLADRDGSAQLNRLLAIPDLAGLNLLEQMRTGQVLEP